MIQRLSNLTERIRESEKIVLPQVAHPEPASARRGADPAPRLQWVDYAKGICILCVVFGHTVGGLQAAGMMPMSGLHAYATQVMYAFRMPTMFFLSGLFLYRSLGKRDAAAFVKDRCAVLVYPFLLWSIIHAGVRQVVAQDVNFGPDFFSVLKTLPYRPFGELWFLYVLFAVSMLILALNRSGVGPWLVLAMGAGLYGIHVLFLGDAWGMAELICRFSLYVTLGYLCSAYLTTNLLSLSSGKWGMIVIGFFGLLCVLTPWVSYLSPAGGPLLALLGGGAVIAASKWLEARDGIPLLRRVARGRSRFIWPIPWRPAGYASGWPKSLDIMRSSR